MIEFSSLGLSSFSYQANLKGSVLAVTTYCKSEALRHFAQPCSYLWAASLYSSSTYKIFFNVSNSGVSLLIGTIYSM